MRKINLTKQPEGILITDLNESHIIAYRETLESGDVIFGTIKKTSFGRFIASGIVRNDRYENVAVFKSIQEIVKFLIMHDCEVYVFTDAKELFKFFAGKKDKRILVYDDKFDFVMTDPKTLKDDDFIGVEYTDGQRGFIVKINVLQYTAVEINNNDHGSMIICSTIEEVLTHELVKGAFEFSTRADLVKWVSEEKNINDNK